MDTKLIHSLVIEEDLESDMFISIALIDMAIVNDL